MYMHLALGTGPWAIWLRDLSLEPLFSRRKKNSLPHAERTMDPHLPEPGEAPWDLAPSLSVRLPRDQRAHSLLRS